MEERLTKDEKKKLRQEEWKKELDQEHKKKTRNRIFTWGIGAVILAFAVWFVVAVMTQSSSSTTDNSIKMPPITSKDIIEGPQNAKIQLVEYADFQCPSCKAYYPLVKQLQTDFSGNMLFVYRYFPLSSIHQNAINAAKAAEAARQQGKFWEMHDKLFETQDDWATLSDPESTFISYATSLGLDKTKFQKDYEDQATEKTVQNSESNALDLGLSGTPTFFLNGQMLTNPGSYDDFKKLLQAQLQKK